MRLQSDDAEEVTIQIRESDGIRIGAVIGDLDLTNSHVALVQLQNAADAQDAFVVSLEQCSYCDSHGLASLIALRKQVGTHFALVLPDDSRLRQIFRATSLDKLMDIVTSVELAVSRLNASTSTGR